MGLGIFLHSVRLVIGDWRNALKLTGLLYLLYAVPNLLVGLMFPPPKAADQVSTSTLATGPLSLVVALLAIVAFVWIAVAWHRYILLDEFPEGQLPDFNRSRMLSYGGYSIVLGLIGFVLSIVLTAVIGVVAIPLLGFVGVTITTLIGIAAVLVVGYRLAPLLPATAIGKPMSIGQAWEATKGATGQIVILAIVSAIAAVVVDIPAFILSFGGSVGVFLALLWTLATGWVKMLVGVSILTSIYGHYVEGRAIPTAALSANT